MSDERVGWIGLGNMGLAMASHVQQYLASSNRPGLTFTNRTLSRGDGLVATGARGVKGVKEVAEKSDLIFISVSNDDVVKSSIEAIIESGINLHGKTICDMSTIRPDSAEYLHTKLSPLGAQFVAAPVFGSTSVAEAGGLVVILSGNTTAVDRIIPYTKNVMARAFIRLDENPRSSCTLKITGNSILVSLAEILSCAHVLAEKSGVGSEPLEQLIDIMFNGGPMLNYSKRITGGNYAPDPDTRPSFGIDLAIKDAGYVLNLAKEVGAQLPVVEVAEKHLKAAREKEGENLDSTAIYGVLREEAGLPFATGVVMASGRRMNTAG